jgi:hypothetical protein
VVEPIHGTDLPPLARTSSPMGLGLVAQSARAFPAFQRMQACCHYRKSIRFPVPGWTQRELLIQEWFPRKKKNANRRGFLKIDMCPQVRIGQ